MSPSPRDVRKLLARLAARTCRHSGSCCTFDESNNVVVTEESCKCSDVERDVHKFFNNFGRAGTLQRFA